MKDNKDNKKDGLISVDSLNTTENNTSDGIISAGDTNTTGNIYTSSGESCNDFSYDNSIFSEASPKVEIVENNSDITDINETSSHCSHKQMFCPNCGEEYSTQKHCGICGSCLIKTYFCQHCDTDLLQAAQNYSNVNFCPKCGKELPPKQKELFPKQEISKKLKKFCDKCEKVYDNTNENVYCPKCSSKLKELKCPVCGEIFEYGKQSLYCPICGSENPFLFNVKQLQAIISAKPGDTIIFGRYPYEFDGTKKSMEWIVLDKDSFGRLLILSKYCIDTIYDGPRFRLIYFIIYVGSFFFIFTKNYLLNALGRFGMLIFILFWGTLIDYLFLYLKRRNIYNSISFSAKEKKLVDISLGEIFFNIKQWKQYHLYLINENAMTALPTPYIKNKENISENTFCRWNIEHPYFINEKGQLSKNYSLFFYFFFMCIYYLHTWIITIISIENDKLLLAYYLIADILVYYIVLRFILKNNNYNVITLIVAILLFSIMSDVSFYNYYIIHNYSILLALIVTYANSFIKLAVRPIFRLSLDSLKKDIYI